MFFDDKVFIAKKIRLARKNAKLTQEELAEKVGITSKQLSRIESCSHFPSLNTFFKIVQILNIDLAEFGYNSAPQKNQNRENFNKILSTLTDVELDFCYETIKTMANNFKKL